MNEALAVLIVGVAATALSDVWGYTRPLLSGVPAPDYGLVGRWFGHMPRGTFRHASIMKAVPVPGEKFLGWSAHYLIGIAYAALLFLWQGADWIRQPTPGPALVVGLVTVAAPFFLMQPAMGAGIAASRTPKPNVARLHSLLMHGVFGTGLYAGGLLARATLSS